VNAESVDWIDLRQKRGRCLSAMLDNGLRSSASSRPRRSSGFGPANLYDGIEPGILEPRRAGTIGGDYGSPKRVG
jgi:hypothetical protein